MHERRGHRVRGARQVVALVEDDQAEARAQVVHVDVRRVVRRDGDRSHVVLPAAHEADGDAEGRRRAGRTTGERDRALAPPPARFFGDRRSRARPRGSCRPPSEARRPPVRGRAARPRSPPSGTAAARGARWLRARAPRTFAPCLRRGPSRPRAPARRWRTRPRARDGTASADRTRNRPAEGAPRAPREPPASRRRTRATARSGAL